MTIRRWGVATLAAALLFVPGLTACGQTEGSEPGSQGTGSGSVPADPKEALLASTKEIAKGNFRFTMKGQELDGEGLVHLPSRSAQMKMNAGDAELGFSMNLDLIYIEPDSWVKIQIEGAEGLPGLEKLNTGKYQHLDPSKIKDNDDLSFDFEDVDPAGTEILTKAIVDVQKTGEGAYSGNLDLTKATDAGMVDEEAIKTLGADAGKVPFEAKLDAQGRLSSLTIKMPAAGEAKAHELVVTYTDYGAATGAKKPADSEVVEAPAETYDLFNS
ncbi:hypothetical protein [Plantactinospora sonchi]|uniref:Lipoprotein n=1 Tax=Plantactinospora sonchi TaxID=1544735 RepID=A0ABU7RKG1_9ACTN